PGGPGRHRAVRADPGPDHQGAGRRHAELVGRGLLMVGIAPTADVAEPATTAPSGGASRLRRPGFAWLGLLPFLLFVGVVFVVPIAFILFDAFRRTTTGAVTRDPVTQQFIKHTTTSFTGANMSES